MKLRSGTFVLILCTISSAAAAATGVGVTETRNYDGYKVLRASCSTTKQHVALRKFSSDVESRGIDFWTEPGVGRFTDILVAQEKLKEVENFFKSNGIPSVVHIDDIGQILSQQHAARDAYQINEGRIAWDQYQSLSTIYSWLAGLARDYPALVSIQSIGKSTENRDLFLLKISKPNGGSHRPAFWIDSTIHAREWISVATNTYIINELVTKSGQYSDLLDSIDFYFLPIVNPDGYSYTFTNDRMWRKTRSNHNSTAGCMGVDANRNFGFHFGGPGSSNDKCSETYRGPAAYSEPEAEAVKNYILASSAEWEAYITLHSYSQLWLTPWGYTKDLPSDYPELKRVADEAAEALKSFYGTAYEVGSSANILYESSGSSRDWAKGEGGFKYSYTVELRDTGRYGFLLPPAQILPTATETWAGIQVVARTIIAAKHA